MPTLTPHGTRSATPPRWAARLVSPARSHASRTAISSAAFAIRWPRTQAVRSATRSGVSTGPAAATDGIRNVASDSQADAFHSSP